MTQPEVSIPIHDPPIIVERYQRASVADNEELFAADATVKALHGYAILDVHPDGDELVATYELIGPADGS